jgi:hypothetical protein
VVDFSAHSAWGFLPVGIPLNSAQPVFARLELAPKNLPEP